MLGLFLLLLAGFVGTNLYLEHGALEKREQERLLTQARVIAENMETRLASANLALEAVRDQFASGQRYSSSPDLVIHLQMLVRVMSGIRTLNILDARGRLIASNRVDLIGTDLSHREYFKLARAHPDVDTLYVSPPFETILGVYAINISRVIAGPKGEFRGLVTATLNPEYFRRLMDSVLYAPDMWDALAHGDGTLFLMQPEREQLRGMNLAQPGSFFTRHRASGQDISILSGTVYSTGEQRLMAQRTVNPAALKMDVPLVVAVSRDLDAVYQPWRQNAAFQLVLFVVVATVSLLGMAAYQRRQRKLERQAAEARAMAERFSLALDRIPTYIYMKDRGRRYVYANKPTLELFGCAAGELAGSPDSRFFPPEAVARLHEIDARVLEQGADTAEEVVVDMPDGQRRVYWEIKTPIYEDGDHTRIWGLCGISTDITERKALEGQLEQQAHLDYLTGLNNRRHFMEQGETELARAQRHGRALSILMLDIDHFKQFNDTYGHKAGDQVLQKLAEVMHETLRTVDILGRIGGEEFAVLLPETGVAEAVEVAERLRRNVEQASVVFEAGLPQHFTVSIGITTQREKETNLDILLSEADRALYRAKDAGRNCVVAASDGGAGEA
jgi:diguanylate cyclase (GGDEF)-like protein/PAS domain S-box-containing protein